MSSHYKTTPHPNSWRQAPAPPVGADQGSPWAWMIVIALALAACGWWLAFDQDSGIGSPHTSSATPANDPPRPKGAG